MTEYQPVHKDIALTEYEIAIQRQNTKNTQITTLLPQFLLEPVIRAALKSMRGKSIEYRLPAVAIGHRILKTAHSFDVGAGETNVYFYRREGANGTYPLLYFIHGGGFLGGTHLANESLMKKLADELPVVCASVEYHFAPETKFPTALRECEAGLMQLLTAADTAAGLNPTKVFIAGDSAGGNLAAALCLLLKRERDFYPAGQVLLYPVTNMYTCDTDSYRRKELEYAGMRRGMLLSRKLYARTGADYRDIYFSPIFTTKQDDPRPTAALLLLAGRDGLLDDGILYGAHLHELGGKVRTVVYDQAFHAFANGLGDSLVATDMYHELAEFIMAAQ